MKYAFNAVRRSLEFYGHGQAEISLTDNVRDDKNISENGSSSLKEAVQPVTECEPGTVVDGSNYPKLKLPADQVNIRCLNRRDDISAAAQELIGQPRNIYKYYWSLPTKTVSSRL